MVIPRSSRRDRSGQLDSRWQGSSLGLRLTFLVVSARKREGSHISRAVRKEDEGAHLVSVALTSPALDPAMIPALARSESVRVDFPWSTGRGKGRSEGEDDEVHDEREGVETYHER